MIPIRYTENNKKEKKNKKKGKWLDALTQGSTSSRLSKQIKQVNKDLPHKFFIVKT